MILPGGALYAPHTASASLSDTVNSVHPGYTNTGMAEYGATTAGTTIEEPGWSIYPLKRIGEPEDVANIVLFLTSDESKYTIGASSSSTAEGRRGS